MKAALYARVSRADQQTIPEQLSRMREYCEKRGWEVAYEFQEMMSSVKARPERKKVIDLANRRLIDCIVVWKLDRWGRNLRDSIITLDDLREKGVGFVSITQDLDFTTTMGKLMAAVLAILAENERDVLIERTNMGLDRARKAGKRLGRRPHAQAHKWDVLELRKKGLNAAQIAAEMNGKVSETSVRRILKSEA